MVKNTVIKAKTAAGGVIGSTMSNGAAGQTFKFEDCEISHLTFESVDDGKSQNPVDLLAQNIGEA